MLSVVTKLSIFRSLLRFKVFLILPDLPITNPASLYKGNSGQVCATAFTFTAELSNYLIFLDASVATVMLVTRCFCMRFTLANTIPLMTYRSNQPRNLTHAYIASSPFDCAFEGIP